jgi:hypothetical protein
LKNVWHEKNISGRRYGVSLKEEEQEEQEVNAHTSLTRRKKKGKENFVLWLLLEDGRTREME